MPRNRDRAERVIDGEFTGVRDLRVHVDQPFRVKEDAERARFALVREIIVEEGITAIPEDEFDAFEAEQNRARNSAAYKENYGSRYRDSEEDDDEDGFFARHIRGIVALVLLVALIAAGAVYAMSDPGQMMLARLDLPLPLKADAYARLGYQHFNEGDFDRAGAYYERALARQPENYDYASTAANAYLKNENTVKAAEMLKKCIEMKPDAVEPYIYLLSLYPDKASRPGEVTRLLEQGYLRTNDERLKSE